MAPVTISVRLIHAVVGVDQVSLRLADSEETLATLVRFVCFLLNVCDFILTSPILFLF